MDKNKMMRTFVCGDIHGAYKALKQCLERSGFNKEEDTLIQLGDVVDGWSEVYECVEELLSIPNLIAIKGNHDEWFNEFLTVGIHSQAWLQGGEGTLKSYCNHCDSKYTPRMGGFTSNLNNAFIPKSHIDFFKKQVYYYIDDKNRCFVHGGFNRHYSLKEQNFNHVFWWDRDLWLQALSFEAMSNNSFAFKMADKFKEVFIGHTATINWNTDKPMRAANVWNLDTGGGFKGKLTIMDVDTKEYWQSDFANQLYPDEKGR